MRPVIPNSVSPAALSLIKRFEGLYLHPYRCPAGKLTIGYGHVIFPYEQHVLAVGIIEDKADELLRRDVAQVALFLRSVTRVDLTEWQFDALVCLVFNIGQGHYAQSTLRKKLHLKDYTGAADEFDRWVFAGKTKLPGLIKRRAAEKALFLNLNEANL